MNGHDEYLELLAASIDFGLTEEEVARLNYHLASCPECRRAATELRGQNAVVATTPIAPLAPARSEQILRAALRKPAARPRWGMLAVAALLATLGGGVLFAGFQMIDDDDPAPDHSPPIVAEASAPPSEAPVEESVDPGAPPPVDGPRVTPNPGDDEPPPPKPASPVAFPIDYNQGLGTVRLAPLPDGRVWLSMDQGDGNTILALLDASGIALPIVVPAAEDCIPLALPDGSVRLLCATFQGIDLECSDVCFQPEGVLAYGPDGRAMDGFPVALPVGFETGINRRHARVVGDNVVLVYSDFGSGGEADDGTGGIANILAVSPNGTMTHGAAVSRPEKCCVIGPTGLAAGTTLLTKDDGTQTTTVVAFDSTGFRPGWPVEVAGHGSMPSFVDTRLALSAWTGDGTSELVRFEADGRRVGDDARTILPELVEWDPDWDAPLAPASDDRGNLWLLADGQVHAYDTAAEPTPGWPYEPETGILVLGECPPTDTGCQPWYVPPVAAPRGLLYTLETAPAGMGGRINVVNLDGTTRSGWPKTLQREGAMWHSVTIGENRRAYAVAIEPEPKNEASISVLAFAPNGSQESILTVVEP